MNKFVSFGLGTVFAFVLVIAAVVAADTKASSLMPLFTAEQATKLTAEFAPRTGTANSLGWTYVTGANTACTTTCGLAQAVFGVDLAGGATAPVLVGPTAATADACICAGAAS